MSKKAAQDKQQGLGFLMQCFAWGWIGFVLLVALFNNGSFQGFGIHNTASYRFEQPTLYTIMAAAVAMIWIALYWMGKKREWKRSLLFGLAALVLPVTHLIGALQTESSYLANYGLLTFIGLFAFFLAGIILSNDNTFVRWFPVVYLVFGYIIVFYGFLNLFGNVFLVDSLSAQDGVRISSIFQYPNAYAVILLTLWVGSLIEMDRSTKAVVKVLHGLMLVPICVSFLLTLSRGALVILPFIAIVVLFMFRLRQQIMMIFYSVLSIVLSLSMYSTLSERGIKVIEQIQASIANEQAVKTVSIFSSESIGCWGLLVTVSLAMGLLVYLSEKYLRPCIESATNKFASGWANQAVPLILIVLFILGAIAVATDLITRFLPPIIRKRVETISFQTHSVYERFTMYKDALAIWREHPIFGAGFGTWEALYERFQSYPYSSMQTHSFVTQLLVDTGIVGLVAIVGFIVALLICFLRTYRKSDEKNRLQFAFYLIVPVIVLLHSLIDFGMTYLFYGFIVFLCLGVLAGTQRQLLNLKWGETRKFRIQQAASALIGVTAIVIFVLAARWLYAANQFGTYTKAVSTNSANFETMMKYLDDGLSKHPGHPLLLGQAASLSYQAYKQTNETRFLEMSERYLQPLLDKEPNYQAGLLLDYSIQMEKGNVEEAEKSIEELIAMNTFAQNYYEQAMNVYLQQWNEQRQAGNETQEIEARIIHLYDRVSELVEQTNELPDTVIVSRSFELSNAIRVGAGQVYYFKGDYAQAEEVLKPGLKEDLSQQNDRYVARFYLASLRKQGKDDPALYEKLLQADQGEGAMLEQLLQ